MVPPELETRTAVSLSSVGATRIRPYVEIRTTAGYTSLMPKGCANAPKNTASALHAPLLRPRTQRSCLDGQSERLQVDVLIRWFFQELEY